jgi:hypothetical protein
MNDADRRCHDPAMRWVVGDRAITESAASASQMGRFETKWLSWPEIPLPAAPVAVRAFAMDAQKPNDALACPTIRGKLLLSVNYLTPLNRFLNDIVESRRIGARIWRIPVKEKRRACLPYPATCP